MKYLITQLDETGYEVLNRKERKQVELTTEEFKNMIDCVEFTYYSKDNNMLDKLKEVE